MIFFDLEATGPKPDCDRIIEIAITNKTDVLYSQLVNPGLAISPEIEELTGITNDELKDAPPFKEVAAEVAERMNDSVIGGYNLTRFDVPLLAREFEMAGIDFDWTGRQLLDVGALYMILNPRRLQDAVRHYIGLDHSCAHRAAADALATAHVFKGMLSQHQEYSGKTIDEIALASTYGKRLADPAGKLAFVDGVLCFSFGVHKDQPVAEHIDYAHWMLNRDFPRSTQRALMAEIERLRRESEPEPSLFADEECAQASLARTNDSNDIPF